MLQYDTTCCCLENCTCWSDASLVQDEEDKKYRLIPWRYPPVRYSELFKYPVQQLPKGELFLWEIAENGIFYVDQPAIEIGDPREVALGFLRMADFTIFSNIDDYGTWRPTHMISSDYVAFVARCSGNRFKLDTYAKSLFAISGDTRWRFNFGSRNDAKIWFFSRKNNLNIYQCAKTEPFPTLQAFCSREILKMYSSKPKQIQPHTWNIVLSQYRATITATTIGVDSWFRLSNQ